MFTTATPLHHNGYFENGRKNSDHDNATGNNYLEETG